MNSIPHFPDFKAIEFEDYQFIHDRLWTYQPEISELTFTNLFIWRRLFKYQWCIFLDWLLLIARNDTGYFGYEPVGPQPRIKPLTYLSEWLLEKNGKSAEILRIDSKLKEEISEEDRFLIEPMRNHFDYLYATKDLISLSGRKYHAKRNHLSRFFKSQIFTCESISSDLIHSCLNLSMRWCRENRCQENPQLCNEWFAISDALMLFKELKLTGAVIIINGNVEAFSIGELLNSNTAVIHIEKASPSIPGIYTAINQMFCKHAFQNTQFVNREQDLGDEGLRKAKLSYHPVKLVEKFRISFNT